MFGIKKKSPTLPTTPLAASQPITYHVFLAEALKQLLAAKELQGVKPRLPKLKEAVEHAVNATSAGATPTPAVAQTVLVALEQCCKSRSTSLLIIALDCLAKLTSYGFFAEATRSANGGHVRVPHAAVTADDLPASGTVERTPSGTLQGVVDAELDSGQASSTAAATGSANGSATSDAVTYEDVGFMEQVVDIIYHSFSGEATEEKVQLQIFKALHAAVSCTAPGSTIHEASLLKAVRTAYNIFLLSRKSTLQAMALGALRQMIDHVYGRAVVPREMRGDFAAYMAAAASNSNVISSMGNVPAVRVESMATDVPVVVPAVEDSPTTSKVPSASMIVAELVDEIVVRATTPVEDLADQEESAKKKDDSKKEEQIATAEPAIAKAPTLSPMDVHILDAFLIFRALCRLSIKPVPEGSSETKTYALKSKVLSLHLLNHIVQNHFTVVSSVYPLPAGALHEPKPASAANATGSTTAPSPDENKTPVVGNFVEAVKSLLCFSLSRNAVSLVPEVLDRSLEIFIKLVVGMRHHLKKEIEVFFNEILLGILESRSNLAITYHQKLALLRSISRLGSDPQTVVEIYLNYDCDPQALDNTYERIVNILAKIMTSRDHKLLQLGPALPPGADMGAEFNAALNTGNNTPLPSSSSADLATVVPTSSSVDNTPTLLVPTPPFATPIIGELSADKEQSLKFRALECLVAILKSMCAWSRSYSDGMIGANVVTTASPVPAAAAASTLASGTPSPTANNDDLAESTPTTATSGNGPPLPKAVLAVQNDFNRFEAAKHQKQATREGVRLFNWKYKKGIQYLIEHEVIRKNQKDIARFLLNTPGLNKRMIGEYLGEGEEWNISVMHSFVDQMVFVDMPFVTALRNFLQSFRLPGEAQKIDRFMLKFAERYLRDNPSTFTNADCAYVLAYSTIMLNTDQHNPQIKKRMTKQEFLRNNRGINDGQNLPDTILEAIFDEIQVNEIKMKDEHDVVADPTKSNTDYDNMSNRQKKEVFSQVSEDIAARSEAVFKGITAKNVGRKGVDALPFHVARHAEHARLMFEVCWMSILAGISAPLQEVEVGDAQTTMLVMTAFRCAVHLGSIFDLDIMRNAFASTLTKYAFLHSPQELVLKPKYVECVRAMLEIALADGNWLKETWLDVFRCVSHLERFLSSNVNGSGSNLIPGAANVGSDSRGTTVSPAKARPSMPSETDPSFNRALTSSEDKVADAVAQGLLVAVDRIFNSSSRLSGTAIVDFTKSLCTISMEEIQQSTSSSVLSTVPRMYSLTKLVEISYYNMARIRIEWSHLWTILGEHFNIVGCHANQHVGFFSVDSLRQLSMKFLEKEELSNFKFQKDFLRPFEHILSNNPSLVIKDMVVRCIQQMVQARAQNIRSGWKAIFAVLSKTAREQNDGIVTMAFELVKHIYNERFSHVMVVNNAFPDYVTCLVEFARNRRFPKINLQSVELIKASVPKILAVLEAAKNGKLQSSTPNTTLSGSSCAASADSLAMNIPAAKNPADDPVLRYWFPIHFGLYEIIMTCELEVRARALRHLFDLLKEHGAEYTPEFWDVVSRGVIFPIFDDLRLSRSEKRQFENKDDMTVWLNTTLIQALRQLVDLFSHSFETLEATMMDGVLELIRVCFNVHHENETLAKIGSSCLQQLIESNVFKMREVHWDKVTDTIVALFDMTTAHTLFEEDFIVDVMAKAEGVDMDEGHSRAASIESTAVDGEASPNAATTGRRRHLKRDFQQIILKCVLQLLVIQTSHDIVTTATPVPIFRYMRSKHLLRILGCLDKSYTMAKDFNNDMPLRVALYKIGFMKQLPNLLKQETSAVLSILSILYQMFADATGSLPTSPVEKLPPPPFDLEQDRRAASADFGQQLTVIATDILSHFNTLESAVKQRNITTWMPVVIRIIHGLLEMSDEMFRKYSPPLYRHIVDILAQHEVPQDLRLSIHGILARTDDLWCISTGGPAEDSDAEDEERVD